MQEKTSTQKLYHERKNPQSWHEQRISDEKYLDEIYLQNLKRDYQDSRYTKRNNI